MDINVYQEFLAAHPELKDCLGSLIGPACMTGTGSHPDMTYEQWIERYVDGIDIKPAYALHLGYQNETDADPGCIGGDRTVDYAIFHHYVGGERDKAFYRRTYQRRDATLYGTLAELRGQNRDFAPDALVIDAIVRHTKVRTPGRRYYRELIEIFSLTPDQSRTLLDQIPVPSGRVEDRSITLPEHFARS